ncbi:roadblock/LC7 domain-containing protein [Streptomyces sp. NPDC051644]|uniref:roadblock/LC7 domain-containing protein n=1 Tax=unclassified Streptomyces TaxID=2593676 RepID=UPI00378F83AE
MSTTNELALGAARKQLSDLLDGLISRTPGASRAMLGSNDGLKLACSSQPTDKADGMAAIATGLYSLGQQHFRDREGGTRQVVVEHDAGTLFVMSAGRVSADGLSTMLAVDTTPDADPGLIGHAMETFINGLDEHLVTQARDRDRRTTVSG